METSLLWAMADGEGAGGLNLSPSILSDCTAAAGSEERKCLAFACVDRMTWPLTANTVLECQWVDWCHTSYDILNHNTHSFKVATQDLTKFNRLSLIPEVCSKWKSEITVLPATLPTITELPIKLSLQSLEKHTSHLQKHSRKTVCLGKKERKRNPEDRTRCGKQNKTSEPNSHTLKGTLRRT